jgi:hypothetical protein
MEVPWALAMGLHLPMPIDPNLSYFSGPVDRLPIISMGQSQIISEVRIEKWD